jgi:hypothetical protein
LVGVLGALDPFLDREQIKTSRFEARTDLPLSPSLRGS